jgi:hypothetical protein
MTDLTLSALASARASTAAPLPWHFALGIAFWVAGVTAARGLARAGMFAPAWQWAILIGTIPVAWLTVRCIRRLLRPSLADLPQVTAIVSIPALLLDGMVMTAAPDLYSPDEPVRRAIAAWLLWFVGVALAVALTMRARNGLTQETFL